ncbi:MAG: hypothetical protein M3R08_10840, partial [Bacteroidota bacterium]|nr:hypothetical protein [Bacteroidota bacterium]
MKKFYFAALCIPLSAGGVLGQNTNSIGSREFPIARAIEVYEHSRHTAPAEASGVRADTIWSDSFNDASNWTIAHEGPVNVDWQIGVDLMNTGDFPTQPVESTTASDGYAMLDSDAGNNNTTELEFAHMTTAQPINLEAYTNVVLTFQMFYRQFTNDRPLIQISTNNMDWLTYNDLPSGTPIADFDVDAQPNIFDPLPGFAQGDILSNPHMVSINISSVAGSAQEVWVRFLWAGLWGYSWFVDDVAIIEQAPNDVWIDYGYVANNQEGIEYGRMPASNIGSELYVGGQVTNFGIQAQNNIELTVELEDSNGGMIGSTTFNEPSMESATSVMFDGSISVPTLSEGLYTVTYTLTSDEEQDGEEFGNNVEIRYFEVTSSLYSLDVIDVVPEEDLLLSAYGTNSFEGSSDGFQVMTMYDVNAPLTVYGIDVLLASGTVAGGEITGMILDTMDVFAVPPVLSNNLAISDFHPVTQTDVD